MKSVLIVDDDSSIRRSFTNLLNEEGMTVLNAPNGESAIKICENTKINLVFLDLQLPDIHGLKVLERIKNIDSDILVIIITGYASIDSAIKAMKIGAYEYITKPFKADAVKIITKLAIEKSDLKRRVTFLQKEKSNYEDDEIIGACKEMLDIGKQIFKIARTNTSILVEGESGTGKELIVRLIHETSERREGPLVQVNCSAIPETLMESEFFGHEKGAFTGAQNTKKGLIEQADAGTLNLDEIAEMPLNLQTKMLRFIESGRFRRVGGQRDIEANIRIIASTNKDLSKEVEKNKFRLDLFYRLNVLLVSIPPLRKRGDDVLLLAKHFLDKNNKRFGRNLKNISHSAQKLLLSYSWPGNVRELKNVIERGVLLIPEDINILTPEHLPLNKDILYENRSVIEKNQLNRVLEPDFQVNDEFDYTQVIRDINNIIKKRIIDRALLLTNGNRTKAAKLLGLSRSALWREMEKIEQLSGK